MVKVEFGVAGVKTELGLVVAAVMVSRICGLFSQIFLGLKFIGLFLGFSNFWVSFSNFSGFEIYGFVSRFDVCMEGLIFHVMFWVC